jgi:DNA relaxase NicK
LALLGFFGSTFGEAKVEKRKKHRIFDCSCIMNNTNESFIDFLKADYIKNTTVVGVPAKKIYIAAYLV